MKNILFFLLFSTTLVAQNAIKIDSGTINKADYRIFFPENWKGKLVMFAHGHEFMGAPSQIKQGNFAQRMKPFLERGFAVAASAYSSQGLAIKQGVDDTEALRKYFFKKYGKPDTTFMVGQSMGGGVTVAIMENFDKNYRGALPMCPLSGPPYLQNRKEFDVYAIFNAFFPNVVPSLSNVMDKNVPYVASDSRKMGPRAQKIKDAFMKDSVTALAIAKHFHMKLSDLPMSLAFNENVLRDVAQKSGGNPFDNTNTVYTGFANDYELNQKVERIAATVSPDVLYAKYDRTGKIGKPVVLLHTVYDQLIPPPYGVTKFENMVHMQNRTQFLTVKLTNGQGHCQFKPDQIGQSFDELRHWVKTGNKPKAGVIK
ncbi:MAG: alpha/beta hydrolase [Saprospiraceae bacterium]|nr:alpha/beta hydrolase [Saprospiraceae bacterium]